METLNQVAPVWIHINTLLGGLFLLSAIALVAARQILAGIRFFVLQSTLLAGSLFVLAIPTTSYHLIITGSLVLVSRVLLIPWILRKTLHKSVFTRREIIQSFNIPTSLFFALVLVLLSYFVTNPLLSEANGVFIVSSLPTGLAALLLGAYTISVRREAAPELLGILSAENGVYFAGIAIAGTMPIIVEIAATLDVVMVAVVLGLLTRRIHKNTGTTSVGNLTSLREG